jgi:4-amino-4-deoxy-L-arabinose transferase-like glycosyltransferase
MTRDPRLQKNWLLDFSLLIFFTGFAFLFLMGTRALNVPDEARYCEIAREMLVSGDFLTPHVNGIIYFEKPPLFYWMQAFFLHQFGLSEWACRLLNTLMGLIGVLATYFTARKLFDRKTGLYAAIILASSGLYFTLARVVTLDMMVSIWLTLSLFSFILGVYVSRHYYYFLYVFAALALLTKGLIGIILPGGVIFLWLCLTQNWKILKECRLITGTLLFLLIALPWHILVQLKNPEFFNFYFIDQQFTRYLTLEAHRYGPVWFYLPLLVLGVFPWTGFLYGAIKNFKFTETKTLYFVIAVLFILVFFSLSKSKLVPYILPCFPFLAIVLAKHLEDFPGIGFVTTACICLALIIGLFITVTPHISMQFEALQHWTYIVMDILFLNALIVPLLFFRKGFFLAFVVQVIFSIFFLFSAFAGVPYVYMGSVKSMALQLKSTLQPGDRVATYDYYYHDLPFYLQKEVTIVGWKGELEFGSNYPHNPDRMMNEDQFWKIWESPQKVYLMVPKDYFRDLQKRLPEKKFIPFSEEKNDVLVVNHEDTP